MVFNNSILLGAAGQGGAPTFDPTTIGNSVWLNGSDEDINRTGFTLSSDGQKEFIISMWVNFNEFSTAQQLFILGNATGIASFNDMTQCTFNANNTIGFSVATGGSSGGGITTTRVFRDTGWYHLLFTFNSNTSVLPTASRIQLYVNGELQTGSLTAVPDNQDVRGSLTGNADLRFGRNTHPSLGYFYKGYYGQVCYLEGKSIQAGDFAVSDFLDTFTMGTNGSQFIPKKNSEIAALATSAGGNSACLDFANSSDLGNDISDNNKDFTATNMASANQSTNTPSKTYSTFNPLAHADNSYPGTFTLSEGNQKNVINSSNTSVKTTVPFLMSGSNIIRAQFTFSTIGDGGCGITGSSHTSGTYHTAANSVAGRGEVGLSSSGALVIDGNFNNTYTSALSNGDVVDVIVNLDVGAVYFAVNGSLLGGATQAEIQAGTTTNAALVSSFVRRTAGEVFNFYAYQHNPTSSTVEYNSGQKSFTHSYSTITSLKSLNTADLPAPDYQGIDYFDATLYEGNGTGQRVGDFVPFTDAYNVSNSVIFNDDDTAFLQRTPSGAGNRKKFTLSTWFKRANITGATQYIFHCQNSGNNNFFSVNFNSSDQIAAGGEISGGATGATITTNRAFKDTSQWYHLVVRVDNANSTEANRLRIYINGVEQSLASASYRATTEDWLWNAASELHTIARGQGGGSPSGTSSDFYLAQTVQIDNDTLGPDSFGQLDTSTNRWIPKDVSGLTFGTNGFYLDMAIAPGTGNGAGNDVSGNNNDFTESGLAAGDKNTDTPSKNFAIMDFYHPDSSTATTLSEGNLKVSMGTAAGDGARGTLSYNGKMYWEVELDAISTNSGSDIGIATRNHNLALTSNDASNTNAFLGVSSFDSNLKGFFAGAALDTSYGGLGNNFGTAGKYLMFAIDTDAGKFWAGYDGTWFGSGNPAAGTNDSGQDISLYDTWFPAISRIGSAGSGAFIFNFGQRSFAHTPPTGFSNLNQDNLDDTASKITAWAWIKNRDATDSHILVDRVRGVGEVMHSNETAAEATEPNTVQRFLQRGVQVGNDVQVNTANESYVLWQWLLGDSATTGSSITAGSPSLTTTGIVADADHFSILSYTGNATGGATIAHGMSAAPEMIIIKERDNANGWIVGSDVVGYTKILRLDTTDAATTDSGAFNDTAPSATLITLGSNNGTNRSSGQMICYAFRSVPDVCKVGSYIPNNTTDGPYVSLGFTPAYLLIKCTATTNPWIVFDNTRGPDNPVTKYLLPSSTAAEASSGRDIDFVSDGFKIREDDSDINGGTSNTYIYMAIADLGGNGTLPPIYGR